MNDLDIPPVTVVVSTRYRGESVAKAVQTILLNDYSHFELRVIDQSDNDAIESFLRPFLHNPNLQLIKSATKGLSAGINLGISNSKSELIAVIDDDCEAPVQWLRNLISALLMDQRIGIVFGNVRAGPHDRTAGFIPAYVRNEPFLARRLYEKQRVAGISAGMGFRRKVWQEIGGFDEMFGPGAPFKAADETDFTIRTLRAGFFVYETPLVEVIHHGFRTWEEGRELVRDYLYGIGAMFMKHFRCGNWSVLDYFFHLVWRWAFGHPIADLGFQPPRLLRLKAFLQGSLAGAIHPVNRKKGLYICRERLRSCSPLGKIPGLGIEEFDSRSRA